MNREEIIETLNKIKEDIRNTDYIYHYDEADCIKRLIRLVEELIAINIY